MRVGAIEPVGITNASAMKALNRSAKTKAMAKLSKVSRKTWNRVSFGLAFSTLDSVGAVSVFVFMKIF